MVSRIPPPEGGPSSRQPRQPRTGGVLGVVLVVVVAVGLWLFAGGDPDPAAVDGTGSATPASTPAPSPQASPAGTPTTSPQTSTPSLLPDQGGATEPPAIDPDSGLPTVYLLDLPPEAAETVEAIDSGPPYAYEEDGGTFGNYEGLLPDHERGYYQEFTVETPGSDDRGARRIIEGAEGELYWTDDHYASFARILL